MTRRPERNVAGPREAEQAPGDPGWREGSPYEHRGCGTSQRRPKRAPGDPDEQETQIRDGKPQGAEPAPGGSMWRDGRVREHQEGRTSPRRPK